MVLLKIKDVTKSPFSCVLSVLFVRTHGHGHVCGHHSSGSIHQSFLETGSLSGLELAIKARLAG